jgi:hypothetical protein
MPTKNKGVIFLINKDNIIAYSYSNPYKITGEWKDIIFKEVNVNLKGLSDIIEFIESSRKIQDDSRFWRIDNKLNEDIDGCILPVIRHSIYHKIIK